MRCIYVTSCGYTISDYRDVMSTRSIGRELTDAARKANIDGLHSLIEEVG